MFVREQLILNWIVIVLSDCEGKGKTAPLNEQTEG